MKFLVVLAVAVACASADVSHVLKSEYDAPIVKSEYDIDPVGNYGFSYETGNGISAAANGVVKKVDSEYPAVEVNGGFRYTAPDGQVIDTTYVANENGFQPQGSHLPVAPQVPELIARALAYIAAHPSPVEKFVPAARA